MIEEELNEAVTLALDMPRVRFDANIGAGAENWLRKKHLRPGDVHEPATLGAFVAAWRRGGVRRIYDVGALFGYFSLFALGLFDDAEVTAFEMHPSVFDALRRNVEPYVRCVPVAISDECEANRTVWISGFNIYEKPEGGWDALASVPGAMKPRGEGNRGRGFAEVDFTTLNSWCETHAPPDLIKIDVEAYQARAVRGGLRMIAAHRPMIVIELHAPDKLARMGTSNRETVQPLFDLGYTAFWCGNFRDKGARFRRIDAMTEEQEQLSLMVFAPH